MILARGDTVSTGPNLSFGIRDVTRDHINQMPSTLEVDEWQTTDKCLMIYLHITRPELR